MQRPPIFGQSIEAFYAQEDLRTAVDSLIDEAMPVSYSPAEYVEFEPGVLNQVKPPAHTYSFFGGKILVEDEDRTGSKPGIDKPQRLVTVTGPLAEFTVGEIVANTHGDAKIEIKREGPADVCEVMAGLLIACHQVKSRQQQNHEGN